MLYSEITSFMLVSSFFLCCKFSNSLHYFINKGAALQMFVRNMSGIFWGKNTWIKSILYFYYSFVDGGCIILTKCACDLGEFTPHLPAMG